MIRKVGTHQVATNASCFVELVKISRKILRKLANGIKAALINSTL